MTLSSLTISFIPQLGSTSVTEGFAFTHPGALHRARWMSKIIYCIKIVLLSEKISKELSKGAILSNAQLQKLQKFDGAAEATGQVSHHGM